ncbi:hypothetical protein WME73_14965 [Sorangium sp. So ce302]|uniref:hypothetical protein n=1 Tax=unclassified Sorangium TaxID=2621164 RepID=UPI003F6170AA
MRCGANTAALERRLARGQLDELSEIVTEHVGRPAGASSASLTLSRGAVYLASAPMTIHVVRLGELPAVMARRC